MSNSTAVEVIPPQREDDGRWRKGHTQSGPGRPPGEIGFTRSLRDALQKSFEELGGVDYLIMLGMWKPEVYAQLMGRMIPVKVIGDDDGVKVINKVTRRVLPKTNE